MAKFGKKWSQLSKKESKKMKAKYGSRSEWQKAKAKSQAHTNNSSEAKSSPVVNDSNSKANSMDGVLRNSNGVIVGYTGAAAAQRNAERAESRRQANITKYGADGKGFDPETGKNKNGYTRQQQAVADRRESAEAYRQSRLDLQAEKRKYGPSGIYGRQSARDTHERSMNRGNPKVTGPAAVTDPKMIERNEIADALYDTGYDYSHREMIRHRNKGAENGTIPGLYDEYGGYDNWYNNHSLYGEKGFTGSKDVMDLDKVLKIGGQQQAAMKALKSSDGYLAKYGKYDWAQRR